jgi:hypothetical protein
MCKTADILVVAVGKAELGRNIILQEILNLNNAMLSMPSGHKMSAYTVGSLQKKENPFASHT